jgi:hypothetical protein
MATKKNGLSKKARKKLVKEFKRFVKSIPADASEVSLEIIGGMRQQSHPTPSPFIEGATTCLIRAEHTATFSVHVNGGAEKPCMEDAEQDNPARN